MTEKDDVDLFQRLWSQLRLALMLSTNGNRRQMVSLMRRLNESRRTPFDASSLTAEEKQIVAKIRCLAFEENRNNLSRTEAYLAFYHRHPEVHWALLAHAVSRNGGYGMTDLKGEWFSRIANDDDVQPQQFFAFLERANWLIFGDAYAQLLLYEEGKKRGKNLSFLLPALHVSRFMTPIWDEFWNTKNCQLLTRALIINEQNFIESRVVKNQKYQQSVISSIQFQTQSLFNLTLVLFPFQIGTDTRVAGYVVDDFTSVHDRIRTGLVLYQILYQDRLRHEAIVRWMNEHEHSASRSDYWPSLFTIEPNPATKDTKYQPKLLGKSSAERKIYSPMLLDVWQDVSHDRAEVMDWFQDNLHFYHLFERIGKQSLDFTEEYIKNLQAIERILVAKDTLGI